MCGTIPGVGFNIWTKVLDLSGNVDHILQKVKNNKKADTVNDLCVAFEEDDEL